MLVDLVMGTSILLSINNIFYFAIDHNKKVVTIIKVIITLNYTSDTNS